MLAAVSSDREDFGDEDDVVDVDAAVGCRAHFGGDDGELDVGCGDPGVGYAAGIEGPSTHAQVAAQVLATVYAVELVALQIFAASVMSSDLLSLWVRGK